MGIYMINPMHYGKRETQRNGYTAGQLSMKMEMHPNYTLNNQTPPSPKPHKRIPKQ